MALKSSIYKASINVSDLNRHFYHDFNLTLARHPSETNERMMMRLLAFILNASTQLSFAKGLSCDDEPDLWQKSLTGDIEVWIDVGLPSFERCRKASARTLLHKLYVYGEDKNVNPWWLKQKNDLQRLNKLEVLHIDAEKSKALAALVSNNMQIQVTIDADDIYWNMADQSLQISLNMMKSLSA